jgi:hypothetical protein
MGTAMGVHDFRDWISIVDPQWLRACFRRRRAFATLCSALHSQQVPLLRLGANLELKEKRLILSLFWPHCISPILVQSKG